ncbi:MAG: 5'-methylthioadenosine/S-adenosylhomocysteine nucleosidase [Desulfovibrionales bacterium]|nr:5'-methylthioadenosine/S-adenosylhomocysteine nucleosidase [Desulfovibrionales bacterium]
MCIRLAVQKMSRAVVVAMLCVSMAASVCFAAAKQPIVIQGAMDVETKAMVDQLSNVTEQVFGDWHFFTGELDGYPVVIAKTEIGMTNAAASTLLAIEKFDPAYIINQGTSGGHDPKLHRYDIVLGTTTVNIGAFRTNHGDVKAGVAPEKWIPMSVGFSEDEHSEKGSVLKGDAALLDTAKRVAGAHTKGQVVEGVIGSADQWNRELDRIRWIHEQYGTSVEEMETASAAQVARAYNVPFLGIRILSNSEWHDGETFDPQAGVDCQNYVMTVVKALIAGM